MCPSGQGGSFDFVFLRFDAGGVEECVQIAVHSLEVACARRVMAGVLISFFLLLFDARG